MVEPRYGASIPSVPGAARPNTSGGGALTGHPTTRSYATGYLQNLAENRRNETLGYLQSGGKAGEAWVYDGKNDILAPLSGHPTTRSRSVTTHEKQQAVSSLMTEFEYFSVEKKKILARQLFMGGFLSKPDANLMDLQEGYANLLSSAAARFAQGQRMTPKQLLEKNIRYNLAAAGVSVKGKFSDKTSNAWFNQLMGSGSAGRLARTAGAGSGLADEPVDLSGTYVTKQKSVDLWSPEDARGLIRAVLQRELDRDPTEAEFEDFVATLHQKQRANPQTTTTRTTTNAEGRVTDTSQTTRGGLNEAGVQELATREAQSNPGWAEWQAVGTFFPALLDTLSSAVPNT